MFKKIIQYCLKFLSRRIIGKYQPEIIGITGSVGKTSAKLAVAAILSPDFQVRSSPKNYNTETGVPLTIINAKNPGRSVFGWLTVFIRGLLLIIKRDVKYPHVLILEMAADHPGDLDYLVKLAPPKVGIITAIGPAHLEFFNTVENVAAEKKKIITTLNSRDFAVLNNDNPLTVELKNKTKAQVITVGLNSEAALFASDIVLDKEKYSLNFKLNYQGSFVPVNLENILGRPAVYAVLFGAAVGLIYGLNLVAIAAHLKKYQSPAGRLKLLLGVKNTKIIDDTYNASPLSVKAALETLSHLNCQGRKFAVLGDMLELGALTKAAHAEIGEEVARLGIDYFIAVGECSRHAADAAKQYGMNEDRIYAFDDSLAAGKFIQDKIEAGDLLLVKGSQGIRMEKIVKEIMAEPAKASELLIRQGEEWE